MAIPDADPVPTPQARLDKLEAEMRVVAELATRFISALPIDPQNSARLNGVNQAVNNYSKEHPEHQEALTAALIRFGLLRSKPRTSL